MCSVRMLLWLLHGLRCMLLLLVLQGIFQVFRCVCCCDKSEAGELCECP